MNTESKRVRFTESRGRRAEDLEELAANAEEQHLDVDVRCVPTKWRVEDVAGDAAAAAPEQMQQEETSEQLCIQQED